ncbi:MAG: M28 family peptidase, partial [Myxococcota bacterium]
GRGRLTHNGLGPVWSGPRLRALLDAAPADVPYMYRAISEGRPELERSDHHWFGRAGIPSSHLLSRAESGVLWTYHTSRDTPDTLQPEALAAAYAAVWGVAHAPTLPRGEPVAPPLVVPLTHLVVPGGLVALGMFGLAGVTLAGRWRRGEDQAPVPRQLVDVAWIVLTALLGVASGLVLAAGGRPFGFALAGPVALAGWAGLVAGCAARGTETPLAPTLVTALHAILAGWMLALGLPLLALPLLVAAAAVAWIDRVPRLGQVGLALVASWPGFYLVRGDAIRELAYHQMVAAWTPIWAVVLLILGGPLAVVVARQPWRVRQGLLAGALAVLLAAVAWAWATPVMAPPWERPPFYVQPARPPLPPVW